MPADNPTVLWRLVLCDLAGHALSVITGLATEVQLEFALNRPGMLSFTVPSEDPRVNIVHGTDGLPFLAVGPRVVKAYRKTDDGPGGWTLRYVGRVWQIQDQGDGDTCTTAVTCYDNLKLLEKRLVRDADGSFVKQVKFWGVSGATIIKTLIERTRDFAGAVKIDVGGSWDATATQSPAYDQDYVLPAIMRLTDTGTVDLDIVYLDVTDGVHMQLGALAKLGIDRTATVLFAYATEPNTAIEYNRSISLDTMVNSLTLFGKSINGHKVYGEDTDSSDLNLVMEGLEIVSDVETKELLEDLAAEALALRKDPRDLVTVLPTPEQSAIPWDDYWIGDTVTILAADSPFPVTRQTVEGAQRLYGFTIDVNDEYGERISQLVVSPQGA